jgi:hypothetical protein
MMRLSGHWFRSDKVRLWLSVIANQGNLRRWLALPKEDWELVGDEIGVAAGEDRRSADET